MGTTLTALQAGSTRLSFTVLIEGYPYVLCESNPDAALAAHSGFEGAIGGLFLDMHNEQTLSPWDPMPRGGRCSFTVLPSRTMSSALAGVEDPDTFGVTVARRNAGKETLLAATADRDDTTISVKSTSGFAASGTAFCGTECFAYTGTTATTFTGVTRGKYWPFYGSPGGEHHRVGAVASGPKLEPLVTEQPRVWVGRWVAVYAHRVVGGVLDDASTEAQLVFAGRIDSVNDDANGGTVIELEHVLDYMREATVARELWSGRIGVGIYLGAGQTFSVRDYDGAGYKYGTALTVVASGAVGTNQLNAGFYSHTVLLTAINAWLGGELAAGRIYGTYTFSIGQVLMFSGLRTRIAWSVPGAAGANIFFAIGLPQAVCNYLGFIPHHTDAEGNSVIGLVLEPVNTNNATVGALPIALTVFSQIPGNETVYRALILEEQGTFVDNYDTMPTGHGVKPGTAAGAVWGLFVVDEKFVIRASYVNTGSTIELHDVYPVGSIAGFAEIPDALRYTFQLADVNGLPSVSVRQIVMMEMPFSTAFHRFLFSTGTLDYNSGLWDKLAYGFGLGIPSSLLGNLEQSWLTIPGQLSTIMVVLDKPTKFVDLFMGDMVLRCAFFRWKDGGIEVATWKTPLTGLAVASLTESNKAAPTTSQDDHRTATREGSEWQRPIVKIQYNRDATSTSESYRSSLTLQDRVAIDDLGGDAPVATVKCRNTYGQYANTGAGVEALAPGFISIWPLFSRPARLLSRSIDLRSFEGLSIGDCVTVADSFARDPNTGTRSMAARPAIIVKHWYSFGGLQAGSDKPTAMAGGVNLLLLDSGSVVTYGPAAELDETASAGGFTAGYNNATKTLRCHAHKHSEASESADASNFAAGDVVRIYEIDPQIPLLFLNWTKTIASVSGNDIVLTTTLAAFDATKRYRVTYAKYSEVQSSQQGKTFQADDATAKIESTDPPVLYAVGWPAGAYTANAATDPVELPPANVYDDGASRDCGYDAALIRAANNLDDYKLAIQSPHLGKVASAGGLPGIYTLVGIRPIWLTQQGLGGNVRRALSVAPFFRSATGSSVTVRVTLARGLPSGSSFASVDRGGSGPYVEASWTTSSTTWQTGAAADLDIGTVKRTDGLAYLLIEMTANAETRGLATCVEGPRTYP